MKYYMTVISNSDREFWEKCKSTTLTGAKRECRRTQTGYGRDRQAVGIEEYPESEDSSIITVADTTRNGKWVDLID